jgi:hypothetical protein
MGLATCDGSLVHLEVRLLMVHIADMSVVLRWVCCANSRAEGCLKVTGWSENHSVEAEYTHCWLVPVDIHVDRIWREWFGIVIM